MNDDSNERADAPQTPVANEIITPGGVEIVGEEGDSGDRFETNVAAWKTVPGMSEIHE